MTSFTHTWNAAFNTAPGDGDDAKEGAGKIRDTRLAVKERMAVGHSWAGDADDGKITAIPLLEQAAAPTSASTAPFRFPRWTS